MSAPGLDALLRETALTYGHIQLFRDEEGWQGNVCHYSREPRDAWGGGRSRRFGDPVEALRAALIEDERIERDLARRYAAAPKAIASVPEQIDIEDAIAAVEADDDFEALL